MSRPATMQRRLIFVVVVFVLMLACQAVLRRFGLTSLWYDTGAAVVCALVALESLD